MKAWKLKQVDDDYRMHLQAFLDYQVQGKKKSGKKYRPVYKTFKEFYDYDAELKKATQTKPKQQSDQLAGVRAYLVEKEKKERDNGI